MNNRGLQVLLIGLLLLTVVTSKGFILGMGMAFIIEGCNILIRQYLIENKWVYTNNKRV